MKKIVLLLPVLFLLFNTYAESQEFKWVRVEFKCKESDAQERWDIDKKADGTFLKHLARYSTLKVDQTWNTLTLANFDEMIKYPLLFMTASGTPDLNPTELKNLKEYLNRGGFLLCDDSHWPEKGGNLFVDGMRVYFDKMYPKSKVVPLGLDHEVLRAQFDMPLGYYMKLNFGSVKSPSGIWAMSREKFAMVFFTQLLQNT
jgi:hypothetical protein